jgi:F420-dependent oxidoreductase-like protein
MSDERPGAISRRRFIKTLGAASVAVGLAGCSAAVAAKETATAGHSKLRFGVQTPPQNMPYKDIVDVWKQADDLGYDSLFAFDHFMPIFGDITKPCFEGWTLLAALAAQTSRARVGLLVTGNSYRHPAVVAKMAATVDHASNGRLILGIGAGWFEPDHTQYGIPFYTAGRRARRLAESVQVIKLLLTQPKSNFNGKYYQLTDALCEPKGIQQPHPPILIGGVGPKLLQPTAARYADIWHLFVQNGNPEEARKLCTNFDALCRKVGRDPAAVEKATSLRAEELATSSAQDMRAHIQKLVDAGIHHFILGLSPPFDRELLRRFAKEVIPAARGA